MGTHKSVAHKWLKLRVFIPNFKKDGKGEKRLLWEQQIGF